MAKKKTELKVGMYLYKLSYHVSPFREATRSMSRKKIKKLTAQYLWFGDNEKIARHIVDSETVDMWFTSLDKLYKSKLKNYLEEYGHIIKEIKYLYKKVGGRSGL